MDHDVVVRQKMTERFLLGELEPETLQDFEEHFFGCSDCARDVRAGSLFVEQSKIVLAEKSEAVAAGLPATGSSQAKRGWPWWLRPGFVVPVMALLLVVIGYQNLVTYPQLHRVLESPR